MTEEIYEIKTTSASSCFEILVECPYCGNSFEETEILGEQLDHAELRAKSCECEIICEECGKTFIVNEITF